MKKIFTILRVGFKYTALLMLLFILGVFVTIIMSGDADFHGSLNEYIVNDSTRLNPIHVASVAQPASTHDIIAAITNSAGIISIGGARYSMGGQTAQAGSLHLDMRGFNNVLAFDKDAREITVQSGITWRKLQEYIDRYDLSVRIMQTYANFTVGGSLSVNVHGRYIGRGPLISSVKSFSIVLADGTLKTASRDTNPDLFYAAIGGYGGIGVIAEVTLLLDDNSKVERVVTAMPLEDYRAYFISNIRDNNKVVFHNANLYPPDYTEVLDVSWYVTDKPLTIEERLIPEDRDYVVMPALVSMVAAMPYGEVVRKNIIDPVYFYWDRVAWRNWEASYDVRELGNNADGDHAYVLQEYFVPVNRLETFIAKMREVFKRYDVDVVNVSIRHALADEGSYLAWAREEVHALVIYFRQAADLERRKVDGEWTREMIDIVLSENGSYYLPYQPHASSVQFRKAYPDAGRFFKVKQQVDPYNRLQNKLWEKYYPSKAQNFREYLKSLDRYYQGEEQTYLSLPLWYLVLNPNEYAEYLKAGKNPSVYPFFKSIDEYWTLYDRVNELTESVYAENSEYQTTLWLTGAGVTAEYLVKGVYEDTIGRFTHWTASGPTPEDNLIARAHEAYAQFNYQNVWHAFAFLPWVKQIWRDLPFFGKNFIRKLERKLFFTAEFSVKALYAAIYAYAAQNAVNAVHGHVMLRVKYDAGALAQIDARIRLVRDFGDNDLVIALPRGGAFTEIVAKMAVADMVFEEIAGNDDILVTVLLDQQPHPEIEGARFLFESRVMYPKNKKRGAYSIDVPQLSTVINSLPALGARLEHIYAY